MPARSIWSGSISFGLVNIPVKLYTAVREERVAFHMLHDQDKVRLQRRMVCPADGQEVHPEHIIKGYEIAPDQYVIVTQEELDNLAPQASRNITISGFVDLAKIDPMYYDRPYYLAPAEHAAKPYQLLLKAMQRTAKAGLARFVMRNKEYLATLRAVEGALCLETMHFGDEVSPVTEVPGLPEPKEVKVDERELKVAEQLIQSLTTQFKPAEYRDDYNQRMRELVEAKARGEEIHVQPPVAERPGRVVDLMSALEASLAQVKQGRVGEKTAEKVAQKPHRGETRRQHTRKRKGP